MNESDSVSLKVCLQKQVVEWIGPQPAVSQSLSKDNKGEYLYDLGVGKEDS